MKTHRKTSYLLTFAVLSASLTSGCELIPALIAESPAPAASQSFLVDVDSADGEIEGRALSPTQLRARGLSHSGSVELTVHVGNDTTLHAVSPDGFGDSGNPYGRGDLPRFDDGGTDHPRGGISAGPNPHVFVCSPQGCRDPIQFELRSEEAADGRHMVVEGQWEQGDRAEIELHYRREP